MKSGIKYIIAACFIFSVACTAAEAASADPYIMRGDELLRAANIYSVNYMFDEAGQNYDSAIGIYEQAVKIDPSNIGAHFRLARVYAERVDNWARDYNKAEQEYSRVLELDPSNSMSYVGMAYISLQDANAWNSKYEHIIASYEKTIEYCNKALALDPANVSAVALMIYINATTFQFGRDLDTAIKGLVATKGTSILQNPYIVTASTFIALDKISMLLWILLAGSIVLYSRPGRSPKKESVPLIVLALWLSIVFINYFPKLFVPIGKLFASFL